MQLAPPAASLAKPHLLLGGGACLLLGQEALRPSKVVSGGKLRERPCGLRCGACFGSRATIPLIAAHQSSYCELVQGGDTRSMHVSMKLHSKKCSKLI